MSVREFESKREAEQAVRAAFKRKQELAEAKGEFAQVCHDVHRGKWLTDGDISRVIGGKPSRTRIQQLRKQVREKS